MIARVLCIHYSCILPFQLMASPQLKQSQNRPAQTVNTNAVNHANQPDNVALRIDGGRLNQVRT